jgi:hypothetical protein
MSLDGTLAPEVADGGSPKGVEFGAVQISTDVLIEADEGTPKGTISIRSAAPEAESSESSDKKSATKGPMNVMHNGKEIPVG